MVQPKYKNYEWNVLLTSSSGSSVKIYELFFITEFICVTLNPYRWLVSDLKAQLECDCDKIPIITTTNMTSI